MSVDGRTSVTGAAGSPAFDDATDVEDARRGFLGRLDPCVIRDADGRVVWDNESSSRATRASSPGSWRSSTSRTRTSRS